MAYTDANFNPTKSIEFDSFINYHITFTITSSFHKDLELNFMTFTRITIYIIIRSFRRTSYRVNRFFSIYRYIAYDICHKLVG